MKIIWREGFGIQRGDVLQAPRSEDAGWLVQTTVWCKMCTCIGAAWDCTSHESKIQQDVFLSKHLTARCSDGKTKRCYCPLLAVAMLNTEARESLFSFSSLASQPQSLHDYGCVPVLFSVDLIDFPSLFPLWGIPACRCKLCSNTLLAQVKLIICAPWGLRSWVNISVSSGAELHPN